MVHAAEPCRRFHFCIFSLPSLALIRSVVDNESYNKQSNYLRQGGYVFASLFACLCVSKITQKVIEGSFWNFQGMSGMAKTTSDSILGLIRRCLAEVCALRVLF